jgi:hypothetical protein
VFLAALVWSEKGFWLSRDGAAEPRVNGSVLPHLGRISPLGRRQHPAAARLAARRKAVCNAS